MNSGQNVVGESRKFEVLRVSVISLCGFSCVYCAPRDKADPSSRGLSHHFLSPDVLAQKLRLLRSKLSIKEVHLTGGEPTLHRNLPELVERVYEQGIRDIAVTSNGFFADGLIQKLKSNGLLRMNFSVDSLSPDGFKKISGGNNNIATLLSRVEEAKNLGLEVKINATILNGFNEDQVLPLLRWAGVRNIPVRYLEFMKMGPLQKEHSRLFYLASSIRNQIQTEFEFSPYPTPPDSTATYHITKEGFVFGIIGNHSEPFCSGCNRLRMDSRGKIYGCLSDETSYDLPTDALELENTLTAAMKSKKNFFTGSKLSMKFIGG